MVERQILAEQGEEEASSEEVPNLDLDPLPDEPVPAPVVDPAAAPAAPAGPAPDPDEEVTHTVTTKTASGTEVKINVRVDKHGEASAAADAEVAEGDDVDVSMNEESLNALADMVLGSRRSERVSLGKIRRQFESLKRVSSGLPLSESVNFRAAYAILVKNVNEFRDHVISNGSTPENRKKFNRIVQEIKDMSTSARFRRLLEEMERKPRLRNEAKLMFEPADLEGLDDTVKEKLRAMTFTVDLGDEVPPEGEVAAAGDEMPVDVADTGAGAPVAPPPPAAPPPAPSEYDLEEEMYDEMDDVMDEDEYMEMDDEVNEMDYEVDESDDMEHDEGKTFHVDESMLRRELRRLREAKGSKGKNAKGIKDPKAKNFGGGDVEGLPEELNQLSESEDELEEAEEVAEKALKVAKKATDAAKEERKARVEEARMNRALKAKLVEAAKETVALRTQLEEVNLFNAKLLYVNKLMQNRDLTPRQQRAIVESLDAAKSVREAKLLYTSLTESLKSKSGTMTEGRILGSSSRSTRSASPAASLNESVEVDRWAVLAGIKSGK
jgi:hypothetical protein